VPAETAVTTPAPVPTVATVVVLLDHVPPVVVLTNVTVAPAHTGTDPVIATGELLTVTTAVAVHPVPSV